MEPLDKDPPISSDTHLLTVSAVTEVSPSEHKVLWDIVSTITHLSNSEKELLFVLLMEYADVFSFHSDLGRTNLTKHHIDTGDSQPIHQLPRRVSPARRQEVRQLLTEMLKNDIIARNTPPLLVNEAFALFDDYVQKCFSKCTAVDASAATWQQAQLSLKRGA